MLKGIAVRYTMNKFRGLCLYSTATQLLGGTALASSHDTSRECCHSTGPSDNRPVLAQHAESAALSLYYAILPWPSGSHPPLLSGTWLAAQAGNPRAVSLCGLAPVRQLWLVRQQSALAHILILTQESKSGNGCSRMRHFLPAHECGGLHAEES